MNVAPAGAASAAYASLLTRSPPQPATPPTPAPATSDDGDGDSDKGGVDIRV
jgi:hypothetical protein